MQTVCLVRHLDPLPAELREPFVDRVLERAGRPAGARVRAAQHDRSAALIRVSATSFQVSPGRALGTVTSESNVPRARIDSNSLESEATQGDGSVGRWTAPPAISRRQILFAVGFTLVLVGGLYFLIPKLAGLNQTWGQLKHGDPVFLVVAAVLELIRSPATRCCSGPCSPAGTRGSPGGACIQIPLAGIAAIRLLAAAGAGGVAVTAWALRRAGIGPRTIACRMVAMYVLQYTVYLGALVVCGLGLHYGRVLGRVRRSR